ncbi:MAG: AsmA family protein, partial [Flavobacteriaceae bacterium]|nr:AsmA family protein [Flavobacteriaceae bacterium]
FKGSLEDLLKKNLNKNLNAEVAWEQMDLSLFSNFPNAAVELENFSVTNRAPFEGDTLASGETLALKMGLSQLFKKENESIAIDALALDRANINIKIDSLGRTNYDIAIKNEQESNISGEENSGFTFDLKQYEISNSKLRYSDEKTRTYLKVSDLNHSGKGDFSLQQSELDTETNALVSFQLEDVKYLDENPVSLDAVFQMDLENQQYTFLENEAKINDLPLTFDGYVKVLEDANEIDITFKTPSSDFKNFLAVIPKKYVKELDGVATTGDFTVNGMLKGLANETYIPKMDIKVASNNASFKYPNLPKTVKNITIDAELKNETGLVKDTYLTIGGLTFKIDDEIFSANGTIRNLTENALVNLALKGKLNLANIEQVLPLELEQDLSGVFEADVTTNFDMSSIENEAYDNIRTNGSASLTNFSYTDDAFPDEIKIEKAGVKMVPGNITLNELKASTGQTDISGTGTIQNLIPWIMAKQDLKGRFYLTSNTFNLNDFKTTDSDKPVSGADLKQTGANVSEGIQIPDFLDATVDFTANRVIYDNLELENTSGTINIKDETANLTNVKSKIFGGNANFSGEVDTKQAVPKFNMNLDLQQIDIDDSFGQLSLLKYIAPIASALDGDLNTTIQLQGDLNSDLTPKLSTIAGNAIAQILTAEVSPERTPLLSKLGDQLTFLNLEKLSLRDVSTALDFNNGRIAVKPFDIKVEGVTITASGSHGLDKSVDYNLNMDVPARYLGSEVTNLLQKLDPSEAEAMSVNVPVGISGSFTQPQVNLNTRAAINELTNKIIQKQKETLVEKGTDILGDLIGGGKPKDSTSSNTSGNTQVDKTTDIVKDVIGGIFGKKKKKNDTVKKGNR